MRVASSIAAAVLLVTASTASLVRDESVAPNVTAKFVRSYTNTTTLGYPVESRVYDAVDPTTLFLTTRGAGYPNGKGGLSTWRFPEPGAPADAPLEYLGGWSLGEIPVEGQDRHIDRPDIMIIAGIGPHGLYVLNVSDPSNIETLGHANLTTPDGGGILHCKIYKPTVNPDDKYYAVASMGWEVGQYLAVIDITDPSNPFQVASVPTPAKSMEGVTVIGDYVYVGGFRGTTFSVIDMHPLANLTEANASSAGGMVVLDTVENSQYVQMVSCRYDEGYEAREGRKYPTPEMRSVFWTGMWTTPGGLVVWSKDEALRGNISRVGSLESIDTPFVNRVHLHDSGIVLLPLQDRYVPDGRNGGIGLVSVRTPKNPQVLFSRRLSEYVSPELAHTRVYCGALRPDAKAAWMFGADVNTMFQFTVEGWDAEE